MARSQASTIASQDAKGRWTATMQARAAANSDKKYIILIIYSLSAMN